MTRTEMFIFNVVTSYYHQGIETYIFHFLVGLYLLPNIPCKAFHTTSIGTPIVFIMRFSTFFAMAVTLGSASATFQKGFSFTPYNPDGSCKSAADWEVAFSNMTNLRGNFNSARLTATNECSAFANAVPAALKSNVTLLAGVVAEPEATFDDEKAALLTTLNNSSGDGFDWLLGVSVGLEDAQANAANMSHLIAQIWDVRGMINPKNRSDTILVGHIDNLTGWNNTADAGNVILASDFLGLDFEPYLEDGDTGAANTNFWSAIATMQNIRQGKPLWVTQSAWPVSGLANASAEIAEMYYNETLCQAYTEFPTFMNHLHDYSSTPSYGVYNQSWNTIYDTDCSATDGAGTGVSASSSDASTSAFGSSTTASATTGDATTASSAPLFTTSSVDAAASASAGLYTVQSGDNFWNIASSYGLSLPQLESANPTDVPASITPGQVITIPAPISTDAAPISTSGSTSPPPSTSDSSPVSTSMVATSSVPGPTMSTT